MSPRLAGDLRAVGAIIAGLSLTGPPASAQFQAATPVVIYLHGRIVEDQGPRAVSPEFGPYDYYAILDSLRASGFRVLSELRPTGTDMATYSRRVVAQVDSLLSTGVTPSRITVVGFSKGGGIAIRTAARLQRADIGFVLLAACSASDTIRIRGRVLSIYEQSDPVGRSCASLFAHAAAGTVHAEQAIQTGLKHGAFFQPRPAWLAPLRTWVHGQ